MKSEGNFNNYFNKGKIKVREELFAIVKSKEALEEAFVIVQDGNEITVVIEQSKIKKESVIAFHDSYRIITFDMVLPPNLTGFIARVSTALADEGISVFIVSAYSTDHILVKQKDFSNAIRTLEKLGFESM